MIVVTRIKVADFLQFHCASNVSEVFCSTVLLRSFCYLCIPSFADASITGDDAEFEPLAAMRSLIVVTVTTKLRFESL